MNFSGRRNTCRDVLPRVLHFYDASRSRCLEIFGKQQPSTPLTLQSSQWDSCGVEQTPTTSVGTDSCLNSHSLHTTGFCSRLENRLALDMSIGHAPHDYSMMALGVKECFQLNFSFLHRSFIKLGHCFSQLVKAPMAQQLHFFTVFQSPPWSPHRYAIITINVYATIWPSTSGFVRSLEGSIQFVATCKVDLTCGSDKSA